MPQRMRHGFFFFTLSIAPGYELTGLSALYVSICTFNEKQPFSWLTPIGKS